MNKYPFEPKLLSGLTQLYHKFIADTIEMIKNSQIDFSKIEISEENAYHLDIDIDCDTKTLCTYIMHDKFLIASPSVGTQPWD